MHNETIDVIALKQEPHEMDSKVLGHLNHHNV